MQKTSSRLDRVQKLADDIFQFDFSFGDSPIEFEAGQFFMMEVADGKEPKCTRAYSVASPPAKDKFSLCIKLIEGGRSSEYLSGLKEGDILNFKGPFGHFTLRDSDKEIIMIATGTGVAPFIGMLPVLFERGFKRPITLYFSTSFEQNLIYVDKLREWEKEHENFNTVLTVSRPSEKWDGATGRIQDHLLDHPFDPEDVTFYICGMGPMVSDIREMLAEKEIVKEEIHFEQFTPPKKL